MKNTGTLIRLICTAATVLLLAILGSGAEENSIAPPNAPAQVTAELGQLVIRYNGQTVYRAFAVIGGHPVPISSNTQSGPYAKLHVSDSRGAREQIDQTITLTAQNSSAPLVLKADVDTSKEGFPAETRGNAQQKFAYVRNSVGLSRNLRNNAIYDRHSDWMLEGPPGTIIVPTAQLREGNEFGWQSSGTAIALTFRPRYYQKHKNISWFEPWKYPVWKDSVAGWCSWWAYRDAISEQDVRRVADVFARKLRDFGYSYIQLDDGYEASTDGLPQSFLSTNSKFPHGLAGLADLIRSYGMRPAIWVNVHFGDAQYVDRHPEFFIRNAGGQPAKGPWIDYGIDGSNPAAIDALVRPLYRELHRERWEYVKIDALRHLLYDATYPNRSYFAARDTTGEQAFRNVLTAARQELGAETYVLACWGVLPEAVGVVNACRLGWDGFGPATLVQYNSWNNVVWRNDPDHADITPPGEEMIRPTLVSMAGAQLLLTDKAEIYEDNKKIEGARRAAPVPFTLPGQLYDFDPTKTDNLVAGLRNQNGGSKPGPIDADQTGPESPWWMLDINEPYESWSVLARMSYHAQPAAQVSFRDLGLPDDREYIIYEFWSKKFLGVFRDSFPAASQQPKEVRVYAIRARVDHPQIISTSRHITQGLVDLQSVTWSGNTLSGESNVVAGDRYTITIFAPGAHHATAPDGWSVKREGDLLLLSITPEKTASIRWHVQFQESQSPNNSVAR